jgi:hypothetical protein
MFTPLYGISHAFIVGSLLVWIAKLHPVPNWFDFGGPQVGLGWSQNGLRHSVVGDES